VLHQFTNVFHSNGNHSVPSETTPVTVSSGHALSSPVFDTGTSKSVFVGSAAGTSSGGEIHSVTTSPSFGSHVYTGSALSVASSTGVYDGPIVDSTNQVVYFVIGDSTVGTGHPGAFKVAAGFTGAGGLSQATLTTTTTAASIVYNGAFDATYYGSSDGKSGNFWVCATSSSGVAQLQPMFMTGGALNLSTAINLTSGAATCSPVTEFLNSSTDYIFMSVTALGTVSTCSGSCVYSYTVSGTGNAPTKAAGVNATGGTSGMIIDNSASSPGSNIYYEDLGDTDAVQVSQSTL
jgi:hypothetical protein